MAKTLYLMRHAKSDWHNNLSDFDRPLNQRGQRDAPEMGKRLAGRKIRPDIIVCSPARRTRETIELLASKIGTRLDRVVFQESLYEASVDTVLELVQSIPDRINTAMIIGHNPSMGSLVNLLSDRPLERMPTCAIATIEIASPRWKDTGSRPARLLAFDYPKNIREIHE